MNLNTFFWAATVHWRLHYFFVEILIQYKTGLKHDVTMPLHQAYCLAFVNSCCDNDRILSYTRLEKSPGSPEKIWNICLTQKTNDLKDLFEYIFGHNILGHCSTLSLKLKKSNSRITVVFGSCFSFFLLPTLPKKWSFPLRISSVNENCGLGHIYWRNP